MVKFWLPVQIEKSFLKILVPWLSVCTVQINLTSRKMAKILLNFPLCVSAKREKCSIRHGGQEIYRPHYWGIYQGVQQADENQQKKVATRKYLPGMGENFLVSCQKMYGGISQQPILIADVSSQVWVRF